MDIARFCLIVLAAVAAFAVPAFAEKRVALVIGNSAYQSVAALPNPSRDAAAMAEMFRAAGFDDVEIETNVGVAAMRRALRAFADKAADADTAVVFFAGHGIEMSGRNYLVPVDARLATDIDVEDEAVDLDRVLQLLDPVRHLKLVILDACRENPFASRMKLTTASRSVGRGLAPPEPQTSNTLVAYAARAGAVAADGDGRNSPFTTALLHNLTTPGLDVRIALGQVHDEVLAATGRRQEPFLYGALGGGSLALAPDNAPVAQTRPSPSIDPQQSEFDVAMQAGTIAALDAFLGKYPVGPLANIAKREREKLGQAATPPPQQVAAVTPARPPVAVASGPCGGVVLASLSLRSPAPLSAQEECALKAKDEFKECDKCPPMVMVPAGSFTMGSPKSEEGRYDEEGPQHKVTFAKPFAVGKFTVTFDEWDACVAGGGCNGYRPEDKGWGRSRRPVINVSWNDAKAYVVWLSKKTGKDYRLLSEAEWEYAARGGTTTPFWWGSSITTKQANYNGNYGYNGGAKGKYQEKTVPVDSFAPNPFGLYNVHGNVWQWVEDCWHDSYSGAPTDGSVWTSGNCSDRVLRGGSWDNGPSSLRAAYRNGGDPDRRNGSIGFRLARTLTP